MKRVLCPKCDNYITFDETKYTEGQSLVFICEHCKKQFSIRIGKSKLKATRKEEVLDEQANNEDFGSIVVVENVFGYKQVLPLKEGDNLIGRRSKGTDVDISIETSDPSMDRRHCVINVKRNKQGELIYTLRDNQSITGTSQNRRRSHHHHRCYYSYSANSRKIEIMKRIILITGGQRSGKSSYAEKLALSLSSNPIYMATSRIWDEEFRQRVIKHQKRRGPEWTNIEEEKELSRHQVDGRVVLIDCVTLWATNYFFDLDSDVDLSLQALKQEFDAFTAQNATFIFVTNEIGSGAVSDNPIQRRFTDLQGWMNQYIASQAHQVYLMVSGIPVLIKQ